MTINNKMIKYIVACSYNKILDGNKNVSTAVTHNRDDSCKFNVEEKLTAQKIFTDKINLLGSN